MLPLLGNWLYDLWTLGHTGFLGFDVQILVLLFVLHFNYIVGIKTFLSWLTSEWPSLININSDCKGMSHKHLCNKLRNLGANFKSPERNRSYTDIIFMILTVGKWSQWSVIHIFVSFLRPEFSLNKLWGLYAGAHRLAQCFSDFNGNMNHLGILLKWKLWFRGSGVGPESLHF